MDFNERIVPLFKDNEASNASFDVNGKEQMSFFIPIKLYLDNPDFDNPLAKFFKKDLGFKTHSYTLCISYPK